jgi:hypothetical protein
MGRTCCLSNSGAHKMLEPTYQTVTRCHKPEEQIKKFYCHSKANPYIYKLKYMMQIFGHLHPLRENSSLLECVVEKLRFITEMQKIINEGNNTFVHSLKH